MVPESRRDVDLNAYREPRWLRPPRPQPSATAAGRPRDYAGMLAAGLWQRAFDAKTRSLDGDPEQILTRHEARARLRLRGTESRPGRGSAAGSEITPAKLIVSSQTRRVRLLRPGASVVVTALVAPGHSGVRGGYPRPLAECVVREYCVYSPYLVRHLSDPEVHHHARQGQCLNLLQAEQTLHPGEHRIQGRNCRLVQVAAEAECDAA